LHSFENFFIPFMTFNLVSTIEQLYCWLIHSKFVEKMYYPENSILSILWGWRVHYEAKSYHFKISLFFLLDKVISFFEFFSIPTSTIDEKCLDIIEKWFLVQKMDEHKNSFIYKIIIDFRGFALSQNQIKATH